MKCAAVFAVLLAGCAVGLADTPDPRTSPHAAPSSVALLEDLVRMAKAGSSDVAMLAYARAHRAELPAELPDSTLRWLRASGVSERVVRYMSAIDVRESALDSTAPEGVTYADEAPGDRRDFSERSYDRDPGAQYRDTDSYAGYDSDFAGPEPGYGYGYDTYFGYPYLSGPYFPYFFVDRGNSFRRFRGGRIHRGHDGWRDRGGPREAWRERGSGGRSRGAIALGPRNARRAVVSGGSRGTRAGARMTGPRFSHGFDGPRGHGSRGYGNPAPSRGAPHRSGGGFSRGSAATSRGGRGRS